MPPHSRRPTTAAGRMQRGREAARAVAMKRREKATSEAAERDRYSRQSRFWAIGPAGQERLRAGRVLVIGCGALGSAAVNLLARAGVGQITVVDRDFVEQQLALEI